MTVYQEAQPCTRVGSSCLHDLAAGFINAPDLCPGCTTRLMVALDWVVGDAVLPWHPNFTNRANEEVAP